MGYNNGLEQKKFEADWKKMREEYRAAGMSEDAIEEMIAFDKHCMNRDRKYYEHTQRMDFRKVDGTETEVTSGTVGNKFGDRLQVEARITDPGRRTSWIDELDDEELVKAVKELSEQDEELITLLAYQEMSEQEIADQWGVSQQAISQRLRKIAKKLKKF